MSRCSRYIVKWKSAMIHVVKIYLSGNTEGSTRRLLGEWKEKAGEVWAAWSFHFLCFCVFLTFYVEMISYYQEAAKIVERGPLHPGFPQWPCLT